MEFIPLIKSLCVEMKSPEILEAESLVDAVSRRYQEVHADAARVRDVATFLTSEICKQVVGSEGMLKAARKAYVSSLRAYRTFQGKAMRQVFDWRKVHSGHLAKSFGIIETPKEIAEKNKDTAAFKKRPHNMVTRVQGERLEKPENKPKRKKLGVSTNTLASMEFAS